uniref:RING-CH-type domain-containing protein n=1 Tax=Steinernema glaseri TaxID=37863 RepID=A0A1I7ZIB1_9BILA
MSEYQIPHTVLKKQKVVKRKTGLRTQLLQCPAQDTGAGLTRGDMDLCRFHRGTSAKPPFRPIPPTRSAGMHAFPTDLNDFEEVSLHAVPTETPLLHTVSLSANARKQYVTFADPVHIQIGSSAKERLVCRICQSDDGDLVRPCGCSGTMAYVHEACLNEWILQSCSSGTCEVCQKEYTVTATRLPPLWSWTKPNFECKNFAELFMILGLGFSLVHLISFSEGGELLKRAFTIRQAARPDDITRLCKHFRECLMAFCG